MALVEEAERQGFKGRNLLSAIFERVPVKGKAHLGGVELEAAAKKLGATNPEATVRRWLSGRDPVWLFVDDVDQNFQNNTLGKMKVASFFVACREITNSVPELRIRAAVRPNVWTILNGVRTTLAPRTIHHQPIVVRAIRPKTLGQACRGLSQANESVGQRKNGPPYG